MKPKDRVEPTTSPQSSSPSKPKIRVVHVVAPDIIETDAANFREVVQRLTGKPGNGKTMAMKKKRKRRSRSGRPRVTAPVAGDVAGKPGDGEAAAEEEEGGDCQCGGVEREEEEERESWMEMEMKRSSEGGSDPCREFGEIDGFLQELSEVPFPNLIK